MSINESKLPYNQGSSNPEGAAPKENYFTKCRKKLPYSVRTVLFPVILFLLTLIATGIVSYSAKFDIIISLGVLSSAVSIYTALFAFLTWLNLQKLQYSVPESPASTGGFSAILVIDVGGKNVWGNVNNFCSGENSFKGIMQGTGFDNAKLITDINGIIKDTTYTIDIPVLGKRIINVKCPNIEDIEYKSEIEKNINDPTRRFYKVFNLLNSALHENGISDLYIFYGGPVFIPFFLGEVFSNNYKVYIYRRSTDKKNYKYVGVMDHLMYH